MLSITNHPNPEAVLIKFLKYSGISIDTQTVLNELDKHPDYPSLLAVSDVLTALNIENVAFRIEFDELGGVPCPFIAHISLNGGGFIVINQVNHDSVIVTNEKWERHKIKLEEFKEIFRGVVLTAERGDNNAITAKEKLKVALANLKTPVLALGAVLILVLALVYNTNYFTSPSWRPLLLTLFKTAGLITSVLLLIQSIDSNNPLVQVLCQTTGKTNCNAILSSNSAKVFDWLSWSEVGFYYFAGTWLLLLFGGGSVLSWRVLALLNLVSLPYTFYSIYYQARVAKQWCIFCCTVQALLWLEAITFFVSPTFLLFNEGWHNAFFGQTALLITVFICFTSPIILWAILKPLFLNLQLLRPLKDQLRKFKYNTELFKNILTAQPKFALPGEEWSIVLGNAEASNSLIMVTNPYCPPCAKMHQLLDELLSETDNVQARIVFTATNDDNDIKTPISRHLMALNELADKTVVHKALHDWYEQKHKNYEAWAKVYPVELKETEFHKIDKQHAWCQMAEVTATPTMLLNGYRLPTLYQLPDLKYMLYNDQN